MGQIEQAVSDGCAQFDECDENGGYVEKDGLVGKLDGSDGFGVDWDNLTAVVDSVDSGE